MKVFICVVLFAALAAAASVNPSASSSTSNLNSQAKQELETESQQPLQTLQLNSDYNRYRKSAYGGGSSIPAPPCPKNYLFSCQPNLAPVPCAAPAAGFGSAGFGSAGAYTAPIPTYVAPLGNNYGLPQSYGGLVPQTLNQLYGY
ncbi:vitelline membrane protein Vm26Aa-like [Cochliomyia hominivorax]